MSEWKVNIEQRNFLGYIDFFIYRRLSNGQAEVISDDNHGNKIMVRVDEAATTDKINPTLRLNRFESDEILKAFAEAIHDQGVSTDNDARMKGLLEATKEHLSDMRKLVFEPSNREVTK